MAKPLAVAVLLIAVVAAGVAWFAHARRPAEGLALHPPSQGAAAPWPLDSSWTWSFPVPADASGERIALRFRQKTVASSSSPTTQPTFVTPTKPMSRAEADRTFDTATITTTGTGTGERATSGSASIQLLSLSDIGAASAKPDQNLRVLADLRIGGIGTGLSGDEIYLPGDGIRARVPRVEGEWSNGELHLMTFWIADGDAVVRYDALLDTGPDGPAR